ncbi:hypothetical protein ACOSQ4_001343 [Xanthoceras sorbifolium]
MLCLYFGSCCSKDDFTKKYAGGKSATAVANSLNKEFGQYCVDHPEEVSKLAKVKAQVSEVKGVMMENIEKVLDRGEKIELPVDKTENLRSQVMKCLSSEMCGLVGLFHLGCGVWWMTLQLLRLSLGGLLYGPCHRRKRKRPQIITHPLILIK